MPDNRFESPETIGQKSGGKIKVGYGNGKDIELTPDFSQIAINTNTPTISHSGFVTANGTYGLDEKIDLGASYVSDLGFMLKGKYQFLGTKKEVSDFKVALSVHLGGGSESKEESSNTFTKAELDNQFYGGDLIFGYRVNSTFLPFVSVFVDAVSYQVDQTRGTVTTAYKGHSRNIGFTSGAVISLSEKFDLHAEYAGATLKTGEQKKWTNSFGGTLSLTF
jgi:hypothetical protein